MRPAVPHHLYRCYDADGILLYIGCTSHISNRMVLHRRDKRTKASLWLQVCMARHEVGERYPTYAAGRAAEVEAIRSERPLFNRQSTGVPIRESLPSVAEYLIARGHVDLALATIGRHLGGAA